MPEMLIIAEVARILRVSRETIHQWIKSGKLPAVRPGRNFLVPKEAVEKLLQAPAAK